MRLSQLSSNKTDHDALALLSQHMYAKHRNIFIGIGTVIVTGLTTFVILHVTPGSNSVFEAYHQKLKKRQAEQELRQKQELPKN
ncbi:unnamed protein product [Rotaria magnacalcarata]